MFRNILTVCLFGLPVLAISLLTAGSLTAHEEFKEVLEKQYRLRSVSCKACHTDNKDKKIRNAFGKLLHQELKDDNITEKYREAKEEGPEAEEKYKKKMVEQFKAALKKVEQKPVTFLAILETGLLNGTRLDKNQVDADTLTIKTLSDAEVEAVKVENSHLIEGEIKQMPPAAPATETENQDNSSSPEQQSDDKTSSNSDDTKPIESAAEATEPTDVPKPE